MNYPETIVDAINTIINNGNCDYENLKAFKETKKEDLITFHHSLGRSIRNNFGLWGNNDKLKKEISDIIKSQHPDDMSQYLIKETWNKLNKE